MTDLVPERGKIAVVFESEPNLVRQMTEAELGGWCARIGGGEVIRPDSFRAKACDTLIPQRFGWALAYTRQRFDGVNETLDDAHSRATDLLRHIFMNTDIDDRCPEKVAQLQNLSQLLGLIAGQIALIGEDVCPKPDGITG